MSLNKNLEKSWKELESDPEFIAQGILIDILENILEIMEKKNISKADLAKKLGTSKAYVTKLFHGNPNMTILTIAKIAAALEVDIKAPEFIFKDDDNFITEDLNNLDWFTSYLESKKQEDIQKVEQKEKERLYDFSNAA